MIRKGSIGGRCLRLREGFLGLEHLLSMLVCPTATADASSSHMTNITQDLSSSY